MEQDNLPKQDKSIDTFALPEWVARIVNEVAQTTFDVSSLLQQLADNIEEVFWLRSRDQIIYISPAYETIWGRNRESLLEEPNSFLEAIHPEDRKRIDEARRKREYIQNGHVNEEYRIFLPDGCLRWIWARSFPIRDDQGNILFTAGMAEDITQRKMVERELSESNHFITSVLDSVKSLVVVLDREGNVVRVNRAFEELTGFSIEELMARGIWQTVVPLELAEAIKRNFGKILSGQAPEKGEVEMITRMGQRKLTSWSLSCLRDELGDTKFIIATGTDITESRQMAQALLNSEQRFRQLAENARDIIYRQRLQPEPFYEYISPVTLKVTGYSPEDFYTNSMLDLECVLPEDRDKVEKLYEGQFKEQDAYRWRHKNGQIVWLEVLRTPVRDEKGRLIAIEGVARDITERKQLEQKLRYLSMHDGLTGLYNRSYFEEEMHRLDTSRANPVGLMIIDMDGLKKVNDSLGHAAGDRLITRTAGVIRNCFRKNDVVARIGGDEFAILLGQTSREILTEAVQRIEQAVLEQNQQNLESHPEEPPIRLSVGWSIRFSEGKSMLELFREADRDMYAHKPYMVTKSELA